MVKEFLTTRQYIFFWCMIACLFLFANIAIAENMVTKKVCLSCYGMNWKSSKEAKAQLVTLAKREAVGEIFGEMIQSLTQVKDFVLTFDDIQAASSGFIRVKGIPEFFNGDGFGEMCVKINAYVTDEDITRFQPRTVKKKKCLSDPKLSLGEVSRIAQKRAQIEAVREFEPGIEHLSDDIVLTLLHEAKIEASGFIPDTTVYCVTVNGVVYPIELISALKSSDTTNIYAGTTVADVIKMENKAYAKHKKSIVTFTHKKHVEEYNAGCGDCHHDADNKPLTNLKASDDVKNCIACHKIASERPKGKNAPKLTKKQRLEYHAEAIHYNCKGCHKKFNKKIGTKAAPTTCAKCHPKK